ncbi:MAG: DUF1549 and DUF1553 domain-containing protein [Pirellulales bacterium]|nr:DUF1549 and DUF1553 domain-containing protein [Pirellulales bacterium]
MTTVFAPQLSVRCIRFWIAAGATATAILVFVGAASGQDTTPKPVDPAERYRNAAPDYGIDQVRYINELIRKHWADYELTPAEPASDAEWCRRVYLDIVGRIPSYQELAAFLKEKSPNKRATLVQKLLAEDDSEEYAEDYVRNWSTIWTNILIGRSGGTDRRSMTNRDGMQSYLRRAMARNKPYDRMAYELISAQGGSRPGSENFNGAVNFLADKLAEKAALATSETSKIFLGLQVQCTQCHNHPFNEWKQNQFWELNAFFRQTRPLRRYEGGRDVAFIELENEDFGGEGGGDAEDAEIYYELRNGLVKVAYPVFVDGTALDSTSGFVEDVDRRTELAKLVIKSDLMPRAIVNRMWAHFFGYGFTKPIDDMGPHNPPTHPELLDRLAKDFKQGGHNLKDLITWFTLSEAYSLSSRMSSGNQADDPTLGEKPAFSRFYLRQMQAEHLYESLIVATQAHKSQGSYEKQEESKRRWMSQFVTAFGTDEGGETTTFDGTIPQALMMFNGQLTKAAISDKKGGYLDKLANSRLSFSKKVEYLYLSAFARRPERKETMIANQVLRLRKGNTMEALQDIWWALLNSNEFIMNH